MIITYYLMSNHIVMKKINIREALNLQVFDLLSYFKYLIFDTESFEDPSSYNDRSASRKLVGQHVN